MQQAGGGMKCGCQLPVHPAVPTDTSWEPPTSAEQTLTNTVPVGLCNVSFVTCASLGTASLLACGQMGTPSVMSSSSPIFFGADSWPGASVEWQPLPCPSQVPLSTITVCGCSNV